MCDGQSWLPICPQSFQPEVQMRQNIPKGRSLITRLGCPCSRGPVLFINGLSAARSKAFQELRGHLCWQTGFLMSTRPGVFYDVNNSMTSHLIYKYFSLVSCKPYRSFTFWQGNGSHARHDPARPPTHRQFLSEAIV